MALIEKKTLQVPSRLKLNSTDRLKNSDDDCISTCNRTSFETLLQNFSLVGRIASSRVVVDCFCRKL